MNIFSGTNIFTKMIQKVVFRNNTTHFIYNSSKFIKNRFLFFIGFSFSNVVYSIIFYLSDSFSSNAIFFAYRFKSHFISTLVKPESTHNNILGSVWQRTQKPFNNLFWVKRQSENLIFLLFFFHKFANYYTTIL